jgi:hypothetical protein
MVSNAPETIGMGVPGSWQFGTQPSRNLCKVLTAIVPLAARPSRVRVFFWHVSNFEEPTWWGVIVGLSSGANIAGLKGQVFVGDTNDIGKKKVGASRTLN